MYKVIIADDEPIMRKAMSSLIQWGDLDCELILLAGNGQEVLESLGTLQPDILILDIQMPGMSGIELAQYAWEQKLPVKVILLTAYADFSYAHAAIKYDVVDYVIKTGAFEGLEVAIKKAQAQLQKEREQQTEPNIDALKDNFFKSVFDGSLYEEQEIREQAQRLHIDPGAGYLIMVIHFRIDNDRTGEKRQRSYDSSLKFLRMVFDRQMLHGVTVRKDMIALVLTEIGEDYREDIHQKCLQIIDMMDNFMKMYVYIGISDQSIYLSELKSKFDQAEYAVGESFYDEKSKINIYHGREYEAKQYQEEIDKELEELKYLIKKGEPDHARKRFREILSLYKQMGGPTSMILNTGVNIRIWCGTILSEYDKDIYKITGLEGSISSSIHQCWHVSDLVMLMESVISGTAEYMAMAVHKKTAYVYECEKFIQENYEKSITALDVAQSIGVSHSYLSRVFREATGDTIIYSINKKKVEKAKEYLRDTDMKVYEISDTLGFENVSYFSYFFKKHTGLSPKEYKEKSGK